MNITKNKNNKKINIHKIYSTYLLIENAGQFLGILYNIIVIIYINHKYKL